MPTPPAAQADKTSQLAKQGGDSVEQAIEAMVLIKKSSEQVSDIIQVISEIASQTNLLALERGDRGGPGRRARPGLRRRRRRGPQAGRALERRRQGDHRADQGIDPPRGRRRPAFGKGRRVAGADRPGRPGDRRQHHQDRPGHQASSPRPRPRSTRPSRTSPASPRPTPPAPKSSRPAPRSSVPSPPHSRT